MTPVDTEVSPDTGAAQKCFANGKGDLKHPLSHPMLTVPAATPQCIGYARAQGLAESTIRAVGIASSHFLKARNEKRKMLKRKKSSVTAALLDGKQKSELLQRNSEVSQSWMKSCKKRSYFDEEDVQGGKLLCFYHTQALERSVWGGRARSSNSHSPRGAGTLLFSPSPAAAHDGFLQKPL